MEQVLQLALITNDQFRAQDIATVTKGFQWKFEAAVAQAQPVNWMRRLRPDVALVDLDVPNAIGIMRDIVSVMPQVAVLAVVTPQHLGELQEALMAGASSFVAFPIEPNQFTATVMRASQEAPKRETRTKRGQLVAIVGLKGGVTPPGGALLPTWCWSRLITVSATYHSTSICSHGIRWQAWLRKTILMQMCFRDICNYILPASRCWQPRPM